MITGEQICMSLKQAEYRLNNTPDRVIYVRETVYLPTEFQKKCKDYGARIEYVW